MSSVLTRKVAENSVKAPRLHEGALVALVAPASRPDSSAELSRSVRVIEEMGLRPVTGEHVMKVSGYMAGSWEQRASDLNRFIEDKDVRAIMCLTGGYGSLQILPYINYDALIESPKIIIGCDENTALINAINVRTGLVTFHGPNLDLVRSRFTFDKLRTMLFGWDDANRISTRDLSADEVGGGDKHAPVPGNVEGRLLGGNLTALVSLLGTPFEPRFEDSILFLEDRNEQNGILDRWFTSLYISGQLNHVRGVVFGQFENCSPRNSHNMLSTVDTFGDRLIQLKKPSCFGFPIGQKRDTCTVPIGIRARFEATEGLLEFQESALN